MREVLEEDALNSVLRRLTGLEKKLKQWKWIVLILDISILGIAFIISELG